MGWTSYHVEPVWKNGKSVIDRKAECDRLNNCDFFDGTGKFEVLKSVMVGKIYYAAVKKTRFATETEAEKTKVFGAVFITSVDNKDYYNFAYKDMDESCGPCYNDCPASILNLLSPTDSDYAKAWRKACWENVEKKKSPTALHNLPIGTKIRFNAPYDASDYKKGDEVVLTKIKRVSGKSSYWVNGRFYYSPSFIGTDYEVIHRP